MYRNTNIRDVTDALAHRWDLIPKNGTTETETQQFPTIVI
jgi:hypothetical protein